jgi:hypothetical protein
MRKTTLVLALAVLLAGCGSDDEESKDPATVKSDDAKSKAAVRTLVTGVEACYVENQDYSACKKPQGTGVKLGSGEGQAEVTEASTGGYTVVGHSKSGNTFTAEKTSSGSLKRTCSTDGSKDGGCLDGKW